LGKSKTTEGDAVTLSREGGREERECEWGKEDRLREQKGAREEGRRRGNREGGCGRGGRKGGRKGGRGGTYLGVVGVGEADGDGALEAEHPQGRGVGKVL